MKKLLQTVITLLVVSVSTLGAADYVITINGISKEISLDRETTIVLPDGTSLKLTLRQKEYLRFVGDLFSFEHKNKYKPNRNSLGDGIFQTMIVTPSGTGIIVQEYKVMNPTGLIDFMLKEITKEEVEYGYKYSEKMIKKKVGEITFKGKQAVTTYPGEEWTRCVLAYGGKDKGIIIVTFIEKDNYEKDKHLIEHLWKSIVLKANLK